MLPLQKRIARSLRARLWRLTQRRHLPRHRAALQGILREHPGQTVWVFPPSLSWHTQLFQRPQQLALALARRGQLVLYVEPDHSLRPPGFSPLGENLFLCHVPLSAFQPLERPLAYALTWNRKAVAPLEGARLVYDFVDDLEAFPGPRARLERDHRWLLERAELVLATAERLHRQARELRRDVVLCPNGVDYDHFAAARQIGPGPAPPDLRPILDRERPVVGYAGALARWFDHELVREVAGRRDGLTFLLIGPDLDGDFARRGLHDLPNVHWLGMKPYRQLPAYLAHFDVATIPFRVNEITHATSPVKLFEYLAAGKPVVVTPMQESMRYPEVLVAGDAGAFSAQLDEALRRKDDPAYLERIDAVARANTWDVRARQILDALGGR